MSTDVVWVRAEAALGEALRSLPTTPGTVADYLERAGVTGAAGVPDSCPLACWLRDVLAAEVDGVAVNGKVVAHVRHGHGVVTKALPQHLRDFVAQFDAGAYPTLQAGFDPDQ